MRAGRIAWSIGGVLSLCAAGRGGTGPTAILEVVPVNPPEGLCRSPRCVSGSNGGGPCTTNADCPPMPPYPPGTTIVGNELAADAGGFRAWFEYRVSNWDPAGDGTVPGDPSVVQIAIDGAGLLDADTNQNGDLSDDGDQPDLLPPSVPCATQFTCVSAFGEGWAKCHVDRCLASYGDRFGNHPRSFCADFGFGTCSQADCGITGNTSNGLCYAITSAPRPDDGIPKHIGTLVLDIPADAKGRYTVNVLTDQTFLATSTVPPVDISVRVERGFSVNIITGRCCFGFDTPTEGCVDAATRAECANEPAPMVFTPEERCPPDGPNCARVTGACCDGDPFGPCRDDTLISVCQCPQCSWYEFQSCEEIGCAASPIPTASSWGLAVLTLLFLIAAKVAFGRRVAVSRVTHEG